MKPKPKSRFPSATTHDSSLSHKRARLSRKKAAEFGKSQQEPRTRQQAFEKRWGTKVADHGFTMVPTMMLWMQARLGLSSPQTMVLLQILSHWFDCGSLPWPSKDTIAKRLAIKPRQVQRILSDLENAGLIERKARYFRSGGQSSNAYSLEGLIAKLNALEPEYRKMKAEIQSRRAEVETPVGRRHKASSPPASK